MKTALELRAPAHPVDTRFVQRWSPRAFSDEPVPREHLEIMFEAARWAPSSMNVQPWRFVVTTDGAGRQQMDDAIMPGNRAWSDAAPVILWVIAKTTFDDGTPNSHAFFDTGAATMQLVLQADAMGYRTHHMGGIDAQVAHGLLGLDDDHAVVCALAVGRQGDPGALPEWARSREMPSDRKPQDEFVEQL